MISLVKKIKVYEKIIGIINSNLSLKEILGGIMDIVTDTTSADSCFIYILDEKTGEMVLWASKNPHPGILKKIKIKLGEGITGYTAEIKKPVVIPRNAAKDHRFKFFQSIPEDRYQAFLSVPIVYRDKSIGVINIQHKAVHNYTKSLVDFFYTIAGQVGNAFHNAMLAEQNCALINSVKKAQEDLENRKLVEKAKGIIMKESGLAEDAAYSFLRKKSMDSCKPMKEIAQSIILYSEIRNKN